MQDIKISYLHATFKEKKKLCVKRMRSRNTKSKCDTFKVTSNMLNAKKKKKISKLSTGTSRSFEYS